MIEKTARGTALAVLNRLTGKGAYANLALAEVLARSPLDVRDRAFCTELVYGVTRMRARLDYLLDRLLVRPLTLLPPAVRGLLRLSVYQLEFLSAAAPYAVVDEAVTLAKRRGFAGYAGLVNAVLRNFIRRRDELILPGPDQPFACLTVTLSHPSWLAERWLARLGPAEALALARANNESPPVVLRVNTLRTNGDELLARLRRAGVEAAPSTLVPEGIRLSGARAVEDLPGYDEGHFLAQDEGAILVGRVMAPVPGERFIDLCAAPGGKTTHLAALGKNRVEIVALDVHEHKVALLQENCRRLGVTGVTALAADARRYEGESADGVLLDAPCTGTGVLRRRADLRWRRRPEDLGALVALQREILHNAARLVRPGGRLVYSTCSLEPEENEEQVRWFLAAHPEFRPEETAPYLPGAAAPAGEEPWLYLWPHRQGTDGFFVCRMGKHGA
ncbi:MAG: 16S rRNA (cytosine(967)-C(5))-methyltransferase RsmB [Bacteroidota bacterium]